MMDGSIVSPTQFVEDMPKKQPNKQLSYVIIGVSILVVVALGIFLTVYSSYNHALNAVDNAEAKGERSAEVGYRINDDYSVMLNIYNSIYNDMTMDDLAVIVKEAGVEQYLKQDSNFGEIVLERGSNLAKYDMEKISFSIEKFEDSDELSYVKNLKYTNSDEDSIEQVQDGKYQCSHNYLTNDFETKEDAIENLLMYW